jgi:hypothetical protein
MVMYHVFDLMMYDVKPPQWAAELTRRLNSRREELPNDREWHLAHLINDCGTFFAVFEARRVL